MTIDINSDMGEGFGVYQLCDDDKLIHYVSSVNIACGGHAGDPASMTHLVRLAFSRGVKIGAHPGYPDREGFGRRPFPYSADEICQQVAYQLGALQAIAKAQGAVVGHLSFHAAMGNRINQDTQLAEQVMEMLYRIDPALTILCMSASLIESAAQAAGLPTRALFLVDRAYQDDGSLVPRGKAGAVITDEAAICSRVRQFVERGTVTTIEGNILAIKAKALLIHSDTPGAVHLAAQVYREVNQLSDLKALNPVG